MAGPVLQHCIWLPAGGGHQPSPPLCWAMAGFQMMCAQCLLSGCPGIAHRLHRTSPLTAVHFSWTSWMPEHCLNPCIMSLPFPHPKPSKASPPTLNRTQSTSQGLQEVSQSLSLNSCSFFLAHNSHTQPHGLSKCYSST